MFLEGISELKNIFQNRYFELKNFWNDRSCEAYLYYMSYFKRAVPNQLDLGLAQKGNQILNCPNHTNSSHFHKSSSLLLSPKNCALLGFRSLITFKFSSTPFLLT